MSHTCKDAMKNAPLLYFLKGDILGATALVAALLRTLLAAEWTLRSAEGALRSTRLTLCTGCSSRLIHLLGVNLLNVRQFDRHLLFRKLVKCLA